ncbi:Ribosome maturation factor RimM (fragment) [Xenorhabdus bovienii str. Intermedium]|uniref:Ribosome maturation factor RimM n=1 Tax=Xenorhabdus bovienii str. Intermedium TaxID=1379677 RepID=A0A077QEX7_XENBV
MNYQHLLITSHSLNEREYMIKFIELNDPDELIKSKNKKIYVYKNQL